MNVNVQIIADRKATPQYQAQWRNRGQSSLTPIPALPPQLDLVNTDFTPTKQFIGLWRQAWKETLPAQEQVCTSAGTPTPEHLQRWP